jgi:cob(I)alamin adenosyltransferase
MKTGTPPPGARRGVPPDRGGRFRPRRSRSAPTDNPTLKIYTKTGDRGQTSLFGGKRVAKDALRIEAFGTVDELNSVIGICRSARVPRKLDRVLEAIQSDLFTLGADLAAPAASRRVPRISRSDVTRLESSIDAMEKNLPRLRNFILPSGGRTASMLHFARAICRRAERRIVRLARSEKVGPLTIVYLNRLSDFLFVAARAESARTRNPETRWDR